MLCVLMWLLLLLVCSFLLFEERKKNYLFNFILCLFLGQLLPLWMSSGTLEQKFRNMCKKALGFCKWNFYKTARIQCMTHSKWFVLFLEILCMVCCFFFFLYCISFHFMHRSVVLLAPIASYLFYTFRFVFFNSPLLLLLLLFLICFNSF